MSQNNFFWKMQRGELPPPNIGVLFNTSFSHLDVETGGLQAHFEISHEFTNPMGNVQGGIISAMLDDTMGPALAMLLDEQQFAPTLNLSVSFIKGGKPGKFTGHGRVVKKGRQIAYLYSELFDANQQLIATASATAKIQGMTP